MSDALIKYEKKATHISNPHEDGMKKEGKIIIIKKKFKRNLIGLILMRRFFQCHLYEKSLLVSDH